MWHVRQLIMCSSATAGRERTKEIAVRANNRSREALGPQPQTDGDPMRVSLRDDHEARIKRGVHHTVCGKETGTILTCMHSTCTASTCCASAHAHAQGAVRLQQLGGKRHYTKEHYVCIKLLQLPLEMAGGGDPPSLLLYYYGMYTT